MFCSQLVPELSIGTLTYNVRIASRNLIDSTPRTRETVSAAAIVQSDSIVARGTVLTRHRPAFVPVRLAMQSRVAVHAEAGVRAGWMEAIRL